MDPYLFLAFVAAAIGFFMIFRKVRFHQENKKIDSSSLSPSSSVAPSSLSYNWTHEVFPSFRGEDVRINFLSHIQKEFQRKGITTFIDNEIKRGESISSELVRAIRGSKIAIILLSRNYASSKWCLDELVEIMNCRKELGQTVMAIFYEVDPSDVKKLTGDFGKVFRKTCAGKSKEVVKRWTKALAKVATMAGYHSSNWNNEAAMIERIATDVSNELISSAPSNDFNSLIGMRAHMDNIEPFLRLKSNEVRMIGIWGPSGIGKSTIARVLFSKYAHQFQLCVFMENIKRRYPRPYYDEYSAKLQLHKDFLSQIINQADVNIHHLGVAQDRLRDKRVFVVLDDVDHLLQLDAMAKETRWFGPGSRIIITTQDKKILNAYGINHIYEVGFPPDDEALQIFCMYAFGQSSPYESFENLAWEATILSGKLPLGLRVMGSYFRGMSKLEWKKEVPRLRTSLDGEIESILKFSYDALLEEDKGLFLYIACFFNNEKIEKVEAHLAEDFVNVSQGLHVLVEKSLIFVISGYIRMHDLLVRLGREIVRKQSIQDLGKKPQFLLDDKDVCQVLSNNKVVSRSIIGIDFEHSAIMDKVYNNDIVFDRMYSLQFLRIRSCYNKSRLYQPQSSYHLPLKVKFLHWDYFPMKFLPSNFNPVFLVELIMSHSKLEKLWGGIQMIPNLKWINLSSSKDLNELFDLSTATSLKELYLRDCLSLVELPSSIGNAINLKELNLKGCLSLVELPFSIGNAIHLKNLNLLGCSSLVELSSSIGNVIYLENLNLAGCSSLVELPSSIGNAINLKKLNLKGCSSLAKLPSSIGNAINLMELDLNDCSSLVELPSSIGKSINLKELYLQNCSSLVELPSSIGNVVNLRELYLNDCSSLMKLPSSIRNVVNLRELFVQNCSSLVELPFSIGNVINLTKLYFQNCSSLVELPSSIGNAINLKKLDLKGCSSLVELPFSIGNAINLKKLNLKGCSNLMELQPSICNAINLKKLNLNDCSKVVELPSSIGNATSLKELYIQGCSSLVEIPSSIGNLQNLIRFYLQGCSNLEALPSNINMKSLDKLDLSDCSLLKSFPEISTNIRVLKLNGTAIKEVPSTIRLWSRLTKLNMSYSENLEEFPHAFNFIRELYCSDTRIQKTLPWIKRLSCLHKLVIKGCTKLVSLPKLPESLAILDAENCESLEKLDCSFNNTKFIGSLNFANCFRLNQEARDLIMTSTCENVLLPGEKVPTNFTYRAIGSSLSMTLNGIDTHLPRYLRFKACFLLVNKGDIEVGDKSLAYCIQTRQNDINVLCISNVFGRYLNQHLYTFDVDAMSSSELVFKFEVNNEKWEIGECGLSTPTLQVEESYKT